MRKQSLGWLAIGALSLMLTGCGSTSTTVDVNNSDQIPANVAPITDETTQTPVVTAQIWTVDTAASSLTWTGRMAVIKTEHTGDLKLAATSSLLVDNGVLVGGNVVGDMTTINNKDQKDKLKDGLETHLKSADFFDVAKFPTTTLAITAVVKDATVPTTDAGDTYNVTANLTIKDVTKSVTFPAVVKIADGTLLGTAVFTIDRTDWNIKYASSKFFGDLGDKALDDKIDLKVNLKATAPVVQAVTPTPDSGAVAPANTAADNTSGQE